MSGIGFSELLILFLIGLIVLGPERLPRAANQLGTWLGQARRMTRVMKRQLEDEVNLEDNPLSINPRAAQTAPHDDDTYSPAHDPSPKAAIGVEPEVSAKPEPDIDTDTDTEDYSAEEKKDA